MWYLSQTFEFQSRVKEMWSLLYSSCRTNTDLLYAILPRSKCSLFLRNEGRSEVTRTAFTFTDLGEPGYRPTRSGFEASIYIVIPIGGLHQCTAAILLAFCLKT
jgi:hypothetical protein